MICVFLTFEEVYKLTVTSTVIGTSHRPRSLFINSCFIFIGGEGGGGEGGGCFCMLFFF